MRILRASFVPLLLAAGLLATPQAFAQQNVTKSYRASFVKMTYPATVRSGDNVKIKVQMRNTGTKSWPTGTALESLNSQTDIAFRFPRLIVKQTVPPGATVTFSLSGKAPTLTGEFPLGWRMAMADGTFFGNLTASRKILVTSNGALLPCFDGLDNDQDGKTDYPSDRGCTGPDDLSEADGIADIAMILSGPTSLDQGRLVRYTATVRNNGPDNAAGVAIRIRANNGMTFRPDLSDAGCAQEGVGEVRCANLNLRVGDSLPVVVGFYAPFDCGQIAVVRAFVSEKPQGDPVLSNDEPSPITLSATCGTPNGTRPDLSVQMHGPSSVQRGGSFNVVAVIRNAGPAAATDVRFTLPIPSGLLYSTSTGDAGSCTVVNNTIDCRGFTLQSGQVRALSLHFTVPTLTTCSTATAAFTATVASALTDANAADNTSATVSVTLSCPTNPTTPSADLSVNGTVPAVVQRGTAAIFTLTVRNAGPSAVTDAVAYFGIHESFVYSASQSDTTCRKEGTRAVCGALTLQPNESRSLSVAFTVPESFTCDAQISTRAGIQSAVADPASANNTGDVMLLSVRCPVALAAANLHVTKDSTPVRARQLLAGGETRDSILRLQLQAENQAVEVTQIQLTGEAVNAQTPATDPLSSVDRLELYKAGDLTPVASATVGGCGAQVVPAGTMCAFITNGYLTVGTAQATTLLVRPRMRSDQEGAVSGHSFTLTVRSATGAVQGKDVRTGLALAQNDGDAVSEGEVFTGVTGAGANAVIRGNPNDVVLSKISLIENVNPDSSDITRVPSGPSPVGQFRFRAAQTLNSRNGLNKVVISDVIFTVTAQNVTLDGAAFKAYNKADATQKVACAAHYPDGAAVTAPLTGTFHVVCGGLDVSTVNSAIDSDNTMVLVLEALPTAGAGAATLQVSLEAFTDRSLTIFSSPGTHLRWIDRDTQDVTHAWIESADTVIRSTLYRNAP